VGWNDLELAASSRIFRGVEPGSFVYFTHSFRVKHAEESVAWSEYGGRFSAAVELENLFGVQFHPEKSGEIGLKILSNFCSL
jgi:glutamine amidotransferase